MIQLLLITILSRSKSLNTTQHDCVSRVRERRAEFHQRRETIPIFVKGMLSWLTKSVRSRRRKENEGCCKICLIRPFASLTPLFTMQSSGPSKQGPRDLPESSSSSSSSFFRAHRFPFHSPTASLSPFLVRFVSFRPLSPFSPVRLLRKGCEVGGTRSQTPREY